MRKILTSLLFAFIFLFLFSTQSTKAVSNVECRLTATWPTGSLDTGTFHGEKNVNTSIPFRYPINWTLSVKGDGIKCGVNQDGTVYTRFQVNEARLGGDWLDRDNGLTPELWFRNQGDSTCSKTGNTMTATISRSESFSIEDISDGLWGNTILAQQPGFRGSRQDIYWSIKVKKKANVIIGDADPIEPDDQICKVYFDLDLDSSARANRCIKNQTCQNDTGAGLQQCYGFFDEKAECNIEKCEECHQCGQGVCYPGCSSTVSPTDPNYEATCAQVSICGNDFCEADEAPFDFPGKIHCSQDCKVFSILIFDDGKLIPPKNFNLCEQIPESDKAAKTACKKCEDGEPTGIWTAVGCIRTDPEHIVQAIMTVGLSVAGGAALLMFLAAAFMLSVSQGDPKKTSEAKELVTSAVIGLIFIVFSITILQFIGVDILQIPGFGT